MSVMNGVFRTYLDKFIVVFLDDILVYSNSVKDNMHYLVLLFFSGCCCEMWKCANNVGIDFKTNESYVIFVSMFVISIRVIENGNGVFDK